MGSVAKSYMRKGFLIYDEMRKYFTIYEEAVSRIWLCHRSLLNFLIYEENLLFFFISAIDFHEQVNRIRGPRTNFTVSPRPSNSLHQFWKLYWGELEQWTDRNQEFRQWTNRKQMRTAKKSVNISSINVISHMLHKNRVENGNDNNSSKWFFENQKRFLSIY